MAMVLGAFAAACAPALSTARTEPRAGCHDGIGAASGPDVWYSGEPSEYGNLTFWSSVDGSCSGTPLAVSVAASTLVVADGAANADFLCRNLLGSPVATGTFDDAGPWSPAFGTLGYRCAG